MVSSSKVKLFTGLLLLSSCFFLSLSIANPGLKNEKAAALVQAIKNDPKSELKRLDYVMFLIGQAKFEEANSQVAEVLKLNPDNSDAKYFSSTLPGIISEPDESKKKVKIEAMGGHMLDSAMKTLDALSTDLGKLDGMRLPPEMQREADEAQRAFEAKYNVSSRIKAEYKLTFKEIDYNSLTREHIKQKNFPKAEFLYEKWIEQHPLSHIAYHEYVKFLIDQNQNVKAGKILAEANKKFPSQSISLDILSEHLPRITAAKSSEQISSAKEALDTDWIALMLYKSKHREK